MTYSVHLEGATTALPTGDDMRALEALLYDVGCRMAPGKASSDGVWATLLESSRRGGKRGRAAGRMMARLDDARKQEAQANYPRWWSADLAVEAATPDEARNTATSRVLEAFHSVGRSSWTVLHSDVTRRTKLGYSVREIRTRGRPVGA